LVTGLEKCTSLISLNLEGNRVEIIPAWLAKKSKSIRCLKLAFNNIGDVSCCCIIWFLKDA